MLKEEQAGGGSKSGRGFFHEAGQTHGIAQRFPLDGGQPHRATGEVPGVDDGAAGATQQGSDVKDGFIDQSLSKNLRENGAAAFDQERDHALGGQYL